MRMCVRLWDQNPDITGYKQPAALMEVCRRQLPILAAFSAFAVHVMKKM